MRVFKFTLFAFLLLASFSMIADPLILLTGDPKLSYYSAGLAYCKFLNKADPKINCQVKASPGSITNIENLDQQKYPLGLVQSDMVFWYTQRYQPQHIKFL